MRDLNTIAQRAIEEIGLDIRDICDATPDGLFGTEVLLRDEDVALLEFVQTLNTSKLGQIIGEAKDFKHFEWGDEMRDEYSGRALLESLATVVVADEVARILERELRTERPVYREIKPPYTWPSQ